MRKSTLVNSSTLDDPSEIVEAGSETEYSLMRKWTRDELVETIQKLDAMLDSVKEKHEKFVDREEGMRI